MRRNNAGYFLLHRKEKAKRKNHPHVIKPDTRSQQQSVTAQSGRRGWKRLAKMQLRGWKWCLLLLLQSHGKRILRDSIFSTTNNSEWEGSPLCLWLFSSLRARCTLLLSFYVFVIKNNDTILLRQLGRFTSFYAGFVSERNFEVMLYGVPSSFSA